MNLVFALEVINGNWAIDAIILAWVCGAYLLHEWMARKVERRRWTRGMRVASAIATLSIGIFISRAMIYVWRHFFEGGEFTAGMTVVLIVGATIGSMGFVCAIREISQPLYGPTPWAMAIVAMLAFTAFELLTR